MSTVPTRISRIGRRTPAIAVAEGPDFERLRTAARDRRSIVGGVPSRSPWSVVVPPDGGIGGGHPPFDSVTRPIVGIGGARIADV